jgi:hypothetical protein
VTGEADHDAAERRELVERLTTLLEQAPPKDEFHRAARLDAWEALGADLLECLRHLPDAEAGP